MRTIAVRHLARRVALGAGVAVVALMSAAASAQTIVVPTGETVRSLQRSLERLPYYGVFDSLAFEVNDGVVTLMGRTYTPSLRTAAEKAALRAPGVREVANNVEVLPASQEDDRIRWVTFYRIYTDAFLSRYASGGEFAARREFFEARRFGGMYQPLGQYAIHIIVERGHITLMGIVDNEGDRTIAEMRAREVSGVFSVTNELVVKGSPEATTSSLGISR
jgi:hyperosmotically inducible protein